jgi:hypothetical protein
MAKSKPTVEEVTPELQEQEVVEASPKGTSNVTVQEEEPKETNWTGTPDRDFRK